MKNLIIATAMALFLLIVMGWQADLRGMLRQKQLLQYAAQEAAAAIAIDLDTAASESGTEDTPAAVPNMDFYQAGRAAEASVREQLAGRMKPGEEITASAAFDRKGKDNRLAVVVTVRQGDVAASGWYPVPEREKEPVSEEIESYE